MKKYLVLIPIFIGGALGFTIWIIAPKYLSIIPGGPIGAVILGAIIGFLNSSISIKDLLYSKKK